MSRPAKTAMGSVPRGQCGDRMAPLSQGCGKRWGRRREPGGIIQVTLDEIAGFGGLSHDMDWHDANTRKLRFQVQRAD